MSLTWSLMTGRHFYKLEKGTYTKLSTNRTPSGFDERCGRSVTLRGSMYLTAFGNGRDKRKPLGEGRIGRSISKT